MSVFADVMWCWPRVLECAAGLAVLFSSSKLRMGHHLLCIEQVPQAGPHCGEACVMCSLMRERTADVHAMILRARSWLFLRKPRVSAAYNLTCFVPFGM